MKSRAALGDATRACTCREFESAEDAGVIVSFEVTSHPNLLDGVYWFLADGPDDTHGRSIPIYHCPFCGDGVRAK